MFVRASTTTLAILCLTLAAVTPAAADVEPHAGMLRYPDVSQTQIAFLYANDLWLVARGGGVATPLAGPPGEERYPRFSPDGATLAFMGNYDGDIDLYTVPVTGGAPFRVTHHPANETLTDWTPDGRLIFFAGGVQKYPRAQELFSVPATGGLPEKFPVPYGANGSVSSDGEWLAYTPYSRDHRTWKRYRGGMATDVWLFHLSEHTSQKITDWEGTDSQPMWHGRKVYYLSDGGPEHKLNIWVYDTDSGERSQVTTHTEFDVKWPAIGPDDGGPGAIVYQLGPEMRLLDLASGESGAVRVTIPGARPKLRPQTVDAAETIGERTVSSTGVRAAVDARGDIWTLPAENGAPRNLTRTSGVAERSPTWSPDGRWIAYSADSSGEMYELYVVQSDGRGESRKLAGTARRWHWNLAWSPDSERLAFWDQANRLWIYSLADDGLTEVVKSPAFRPMRVSWSHDSGWLAFTMPESTRQPSRVRLYEVATGQLHQVTAGMFNDSWPTFDREGDYLYLASQREFSSPIYEDVGSTWIYAHVARLYAVPLRVDVESPIAPEVDEEEWSENGDEGEDGDDEKKGKKGKKGKKADGKEEDEEDDGSAPEPLTIDLEGFERRMVQLPSERGNFGHLAVNDENQLLYVHSPSSELIGEPVIRLLDLEDDEEPEKTVLEGVGEFALTADGKKLLAWDDERMAIVEARPEQKMEPLSTAGMTVEVDPRAEWRQMFLEAWRLERDFFYDPGMHGVDWQAVRERYEAMLADCASRDDLTFVIQEMISELNVGHAYYRPGSQEETPRISVGMLGADFELADGAYRISRIVEGAAWDADARGPLSQPGVDVEVGDYLLAVEGKPVDPAKDPWAAFQGMGGSTVTLTVGAKPRIDADARQVVVELLSSERGLRYRSWVEANRAYVEERTGGRVGYIYVPNTSIFGQDELVRQFFGQLHKEALIIDERWNGGGQVPTRFVELLNRPVANYWAVRETDSFITPSDAHQGPKCMLINALAGSGGDYFPYWFREAGLGKLIGTRTWGGLVGISGNPSLIDGTQITAPTFAFYRPDGRWGIEGHGVEPDIEVVDDPAKMVDGGDPQLDAAIEQMLAEIEANPFTPPERPPYPDRSGFGIAEEHQ
jgi:tricorn protease